MERFPYSGLRIEGTKVISDGDTTGTRRFGRSRWFVYLYARSYIDILDDFGPPEQGPAPSHEIAQKATETSKEPMAEFDDDEFVLQLQEGMEQLMREMESSPSVRNEFENLVKSMSEATASASTTKNNTFSDALSRTMDRMQESQSFADKAQEEDSMPSETDAFLAEMLKQLDSAGGGDGVGGEAGMAKLLEGMMEQLVSKEILYEPLKDLQQKVSIRDLDDTLILVSAMASIE
jgi:peroxin-19